MDKETENDKRQELIGKLNEFNEGDILKVFDEFEGGLNVVVDENIAKMQNEELEEFIKLLKAENSTMNIYSKISNLFSRLDKEEKEKIAEDLMSEARESL